MLEATFTRIDLYNLVWSEPLTSLARRFGISNHTLEKVCNNANIPLPKAGHWMKIKYRKKVTQHELPIDETNNKADSIISFQQPELKAKVNTIKRDLTPVLKASNRLTKPVDLVIEAKKNILDKKGRHYNRNGLIVNSLGLDMKVSLKSISRALRFWDLFIKCMQNRGHSIRVSYKNTIAKVGEVDFELFLREFTTRELKPKKEYSWDEYLYHPTGKFAFRIEPFRREWKDGRLSIEDKIAEIIAVIELKAVEIMMCWKKREEERLVELEQERIRTEIKKRQLEDLANFKNLLSKSERWGKAKLLRKYIVEVEARADINNSLNDFLKDWLKWARDKADWYDPFIEKDDELLKVFNPNILER